MLIIWLHQLVIHDHVYFLIHFLHPFPLFVYLGAIFRHYIILLYLRVKLLKWNNISKLSSFTLTIKYYHKNGNISPFISSILPVFTSLQLFYGAFKLLFSLFIWIVFQVTSISFNFEVTLVFYFLEEMWYLVLEIFLWSGICLLTHPMASLVRFLYPSLLLIGG